MTLASSAPAKSLPPLGPTRHRISVGEYFRMGEAGILAGAGPGGFSRSSTKPRCSSTDERTVDSASKSLRPAFSAAATTRSLTELPCSSVARYSGPLMVLAT